MSRSFSKGPDHSAEINDSQLVPDPPIRSTFNGRGGVRRRRYLPSRSGRFTKGRANQRSTMDSGPPPVVLSLMGGGGSGIDYKPRANLDGSQSGAQINGPQWIPDPPLRSTFNGRGGSEIKNKQRADLNGYHTSAPIDGSWSFPGPP
jgi:hypothetical protein